VANHLHRQIREKLETALTGLTTTTTHVYANRLQPMADANLPGLRIYADEEESETQTVHSPNMQLRTLSVSVEACAKANSTLDDTLDQISKEVETALAAGITIGAINLPVDYTGMRYDDELVDKPVGVKRMTFSISYTAMSNAPDVLT
jgi:uncharacterized protein HemX